MEALQKYFMSRGDLGVIAFLLLVGIVVLWRWGSRESQDTKTLKQLVDNNAKALVDFTEQMKEQNRIHAKVVDAMLGKLSGRRP